MSELKVNTISEVTGANGVVIDSVKLKDGGVVIADAGNIGSASDTDAIAIASNGAVTFSQAASFSSTIASTGAITSNAVKSRFMGWPMRDPIRISAGAMSSATSKLDPIANDMGRSI